MTGINVGACVYRAGGDVEELLAALRPGALVVGTQAWDQARELYAACGTRPLVVFRNTEQDMDQQTPEYWAQSIVEQARRYPELHVIAHGYNEQFRDIDRARVMELDFMRACHAGGVKTHCLNTAVANFNHDEIWRFRQIIEGSEYLGPRLYDIVERVRTTGDSTTVTYLPDRDTRRRYLTWGADWPRYKHLAGECGFEDGGWQRLGIPAVLAVQRMVDTSRLWKQDGLLGGCWFTVAHSDARWDGYLGTRDMFLTMARECQLLQTLQPGGTGMNEQEKQAVRNAQERVLDIQRAVAQALLAGDFTTQGAFLDTVRDVAGDVYNLLDQLPK